MKKIWDYFDDSIDYPGGVVHNPIPYGTVWNYISSTFLNGFINYAEPIAVFLIDRYTADDEDLSDREISYHDKDDFPNWKKFEGTKAQLRDDIISGEKEFFHTNLSCFGDDIVILGDIGKGDFVFFYFDMDVSDCSIGKFETDDKKEDVIQSIINWLEEEKENNKEYEIKPNLDSGIINYHQLPLSFIKGWVKF